MRDDPGSDPLVGELREEITANDRQIVRAVNRRLELVRRLKAHKAAQGYDFVDESREAALLDELARANPGPLSAAGLRELHAALLGLTKRELADEEG
ncbi:MAG TPA: chorismate mutase [Gaiellaceae bacterium]|nr:chorismate mutase [Gaiellaceae bacterium]